MRCESVFLSLTDLADGSLPIFRAWQVRRHLKNCAACQKVWADVQTLQNEVRTLYAPPEKGASFLPTSLRTRTLQAAFANAAVLRPVPVASRRVLAGRFAAFGAAAGVAAMVIGLVWVTPGTPVRPTVAFAQVEAAMQQVKTVHWIETSRTRQGIHGPWRTDYVVEKWARLDPPALLQKRSSPNQKAIETVVLETTGQSFTWRPGKKEFTIVNMKPFDKILAADGETAGRNRIVWEAIAPKTESEGASASKDGKSASGKKATWTSRTIVENKQTLLLFEHEELSHDLPEETFLKRPVSRRTNQVWAEPDTRHVLRRKYTYAPDGKEVETEITADHFVYNETLPPSTFVLTAPPGVVVKHEMVRWMRPIWKQLSVDDKQKIQAVIDRSDEGYRNGDFVAWASVWDLEYLHRCILLFPAKAAQEKQWKSRLATQKNNWKQWSSHCYWANEENSLMGAGLPPGDPPLLCIRVMVTGQASTPESGGKVWRAPAQFYLRRVSQGSGFKIVHWDDWYAHAAGWSALRKLRTRPVQ